jgi:hypothetical protein
VYAIEGGRVAAATRPGIRGLVDIGHFRYEHVDALVKSGELVESGQPIGWTWLGTWHLHLGERIVTADGRHHWVNPLRPGGKIQPYVDQARPDIQGIRYYTPATPRWGRRIGHVARSGGSATFPGWPRPITLSGSPSQSSTLPPAASWNDAMSFARSSTSSCPRINTTPPAPSRTCPRTAACGGTETSAVTTSTGFGCFHIRTGTRRASQTAATGYAFASGTLPATRQKPTPR